ncbi:MAG: GNAT family N-acetyltransferase [Fibrobacteria bacterium]
MLIADLPAVLAIETQANPVPWMARDFEAFLRGPVQAGPGPNGPVGWVWANPEVQGFACVVGAADEVELQAIGVARDHWGCGAGSALMEVLIAWARDHAYANLHLEVREGNLRALGFYARWGFRTAGTRPKYYRDNGEAALLLVKALAPAAPGAPG